MQGCDVYEKTMLGGQCWSTGRPGSALNGGIQQGLDLEHLIREGSEKSEEGNLKLC